MAWHRVGSIRQFLGAEAESVFENSSIRQFEQGFQRKCLLEGLY
jgi:hypothetical protein